jgi:hypothetical protein
MIAILAVVFLAAAAVAVKGWADSNAALDRANATLDRIEAQSNEIGEQISSDCAAPSEPG